MQELQNILVPTDFSKGATNALIYAINLAEQINAHLYIAHIQDTTKGPLTNEQIEDRFETIKHDYLFRRTLRTTHISRTGSTADELTNIIVEKRIDLMIMGMQGASARFEAEFGSLTSYFIDNPYCALITIPDDCRILTLKQIAVAYDGKTEPKPSEIYVLSFLAQALTSKIHVFSITQENENELESSIKEAFKDIFKYNLSSYYTMEEPSIISAIRKFIDENSIDLLTVFHQVNSQKDPLKRSVSKQLAFVLRIPLLINPIQL